MAKQGMKRPERTHVKPRNDIPPVPEIQSSDKNERPISSAYQVIDNDLARDNLENDIPEADLQDI